MQKISQKYILLYLLLTIIQICTSSTPASWSLNNYFVTGTFSYMPSIANNNDNCNGVIIENFVCQYITVPYNNQLTSNPNSLVALGILDYNFNLNNSNFGLYLANTKVDQIQFQVYIQGSINTYFFGSMRINYLTVDPSFMYPFSIGYFMNTQSSNSVLEGPFQKYFYINYTAATGLAFNLEHDNVLIAFQHIFDLTNVSQGCFNVKANFQVYNGSLYKVTVSTQCGMKLRRIGFSRIIFDRTEIENHGYCFFEYSVSQTLTKPSLDLTFEISNEMLTNLIVGMTSFYIQNQNRFEFQTVLTNVSTTTASISYNQLVFSYLSIRCRVCPTTSKYFELTSTSCIEQCPTTELANCQNCSQVYSNYFCYKCDEGYQLSGDDYGQCQGKVQTSTSQSIQKLCTGLAAVAGFVSILSLFATKLIGLQLIGVFQLAYLILVDQPQENPILHPLLNWWYVNGYNLDQHKSFSDSAENIRAINYSNSFLQNFNLMFGLLFFELIVSLCLLGLASKLKSILRIGEIFLKQVFLTIFIFNLYNLSFSLGLHFEYSTKLGNQVSTVDSLAAIVALLIVLFAIGQLAFFSNSFYGQFKFIFKENFSTRMYIPLTIIYRFVLGFCMAYFNTYQNITFILFCISFCFTLYSIVNLSFNDVYQNYRSTICHFTELIIIMVANYQRNTHMNVDSDSFSIVPGSIEITMLFICLVVGICCLLYEIIYKKIFKRLEKIGNKNDLVLDKEQKLRMKDEQSMLSLPRRVTSITQN